MLLWLLLPSPGKIQYPSVDVSYHELKPKPKSAAQSTSYLIKCFPHQKRCMYYKEVKYIIHTEEKTSFILLRSLLEVTKDDKVEDSFGGLAF